MISNWFRALRSSKMGRPCGRPGAFVYLFLCFVCGGLRFGVFRRAGVVAARPHLAEETVDVLFNVLRQLGGLGRDFFGGFGRGRLRAIAGLRLRFRRGVRLLRGQDGLRLLRLGEDRLEQLHVRHDAFRLDAKLLRVVLKHGNEQVVVITIAFECLGDLRQRLFVERAQ